MRPVMFEIPWLGWDVPGYGLVLMIGFLVSIWWAARRAARSGADPDVVLNCGFIALLGGVIGSRIMYVWHYWDEFAGRPGLLWALIDVRKGGLEVYGGVIAVALGVLIYLWARKLSIRWYLDIIAPSAALGMGLGRIGCFLNGCCFGGVCPELPWSVRFPFGSPAAHQQWIERVPGAGLPDELVFFYPAGVFPDGAAARPLARDLVLVGVNERAVAAVQRQVDRLHAEEADLTAQLAQAGDAAAREALRARLRRLRPRLAAAEAQYYDIRAQMQRYGLSLAQLQDLARQHPSLPVHPTQLYTTVTLLLLAALLSALYWRRTRDGQVICAFLVVEPMTRWLIEQVRADNPVDTLGVLTISQFLAFALSAAGLLGLLALRRLPPRSPRAVPWEPPPEEPRRGRGKPAGRTGR